MDSADFVAAGGVLSVDDAVDVDRDYNPKWRDELLMTTNKDGDTYPKSVVANVITMLRNHEDWRGVMAFNAMTEEIEYHRRPPWHDDDAPTWEDDTWEVEPFAEEDVTRTQAWMQRFEGINPTKAACGDAAVIVAKASSYHPIRDYLDGLCWDGVRRVDKWLARYCGCADNDYSRAVGRWWMISAVARAMCPGCKVDHMLVLEGPQGLQKSTLIESLCHDPAWFSDTDPDIGSKDAFQSVQGIWIQELSEVDGIVARKEYTAMKAFVSKKNDRYRPPYGRVPVRVQRMIVFIGTANRDDYLRDPTGNRRYWPARCALADIEAIVRDRDQLWAEALHLYRCGEKWYPTTDPEKMMCEVEQGARQRVDDRVYHIVEWLDKIKRPDEPVTVLGIIEGAFKIETAKDQTKRLQGEVADMLRQLGYVRSPTRVSYEGKRLRPYVKEGE